MDEDIAREFSSVNQVSYQITIDGEENDHNRTRILANGGPTFSRILKNLVSIKRSALPVTITLRMHVHANNVDSIEKAYAELCRLMGNDERFTFFFHKVSDLGGDQKEKILSYREYGEIVKGIIDRNNINNARSEATASGYICYASKPN